MLPASPRRCALARGRLRRGLTLALACAALATALAPAAHAADSPEASLAAKYAPVVRLVAQPTACGHGEPYEPLPAEAVLGSREVALKGPWSGSNLVKVAPTAADLAQGLAGYHLDLPGNALSPKCTYEQWEDELERTFKPTTYARVISEQGQTALQFWFFYVFNDYNDTHEGDWEFIHFE